MFHKKIADTLTSAGYKISPHTVGSYLYALHKSFFLYEASRYDIKGKEFLRTLEKQYVVDTGLRNIVIGNTGTDYGALIENVVYLELLRKGNKVYVGKAGTEEIDFIVLTGADRIYYQVSASVLDPNVYEREFRPLKSVSDSYPKYVLTMDNLPVQTDNGIRLKNIIEWLLEP